MRQRPNLATIIVVVDPQFPAENAPLFKQEHSTTAVRDNWTFFPDLADVLFDYQDVADRVNVSLYPGMPPFAAVVADGPGWGSTMLVQPFVAKPHRHTHDYPRLRLRRRTDEGAYMIYWRAVERLIVDSSTQLHGYDSIRSFADALATESVAVWAPAE